MAQWDYQKAIRNAVYESPSFTVVDEWADIELLRPLTDNELNGFADMMWRAATHLHGSPLHRKTELQHECAYFARIANDICDERAEIAHESIQ